MPRKTALTVLKRNSEINLTPLMDLTFILLITFIITFPLIEQGVPVNLPKGKASKLEPDQSRTLTLDSRGNVFLNDSPLTHEDLRVQMREIAQSNPDTVVLVRADEGIAYREVVRVLKILHSANIVRMALVTDPSEEGR